MVILYDYKELNWLHIYNSWDPGISSPRSGHSDDFDRIGYERLSWQANLERKIISIKTVRRGVNWLRKKSGVEEIEFK